MKVGSGLVGRNFNDLTVVGCAGVPIQRCAAGKQLPKVFFNLLMAKYFVMEEDQHLYKTAVNFNRKPTTVWFHMTAEASSVLTDFDFSNSNIRLSKTAFFFSNYL